jgi:CubicO group peptidase (beta-lactamase class C family)
MTVGDVLGASIKEINESYRRATFRHLLSHHAGLQPRIEDADFLTFARDGLDDARAERLRYAELALKQAPTGPIGEEMLYSNHSYIVAGAMMEGLYRRSWEDLIGEHVFQPLGLTSAGFGAPGLPGALDQPLGHFAPQDDPARRVPVALGPGKRSDNPVALGPAGRVHMSLGDLLAYLSAHLERPESFLRATSWDTLHTPPFSEGYAMGWFVRYDGRLSHAGTNTLWYAEAAIDRRPGVVGASVANTGDRKATAAMQNLADGALRRARG